MAPVIKHTISNNRQKVQVNLNTYREEKHSPYQEGMLQAGGAKLTRETAVEILQSVQWSPLSCITLGVPVLREVVVRHVELFDHVTCKIQQLLHTGFRQSLTVFLRSGLNPH